MSTSTAWKREKWIKPARSGSTNPKFKLEKRIVLCPVLGCGNRGGKGFRRDGISKHLMGRKHFADLEKNSANYKSISEFLKSINRNICITCNRITMCYTAERLCEKCDKKRPAPSKLTQDMTTTRRQESDVELASIQEMKFTLRRVIPKKLCTLWSDILTDIALGMADATKESEARNALKRYLMLKAVLIKPVRGGGGRRNRNTNLTEN